MPSISKKNVHILVFQLFKNHFVLQITEGLQVGRLIEEANKSITSMKMAKTGKYIVVVTPQVHNDMYGYGYRVSIQK